VQQDLEQTKRSSGGVRAALILAVFVVGVVLGGVAVYRLWRAGSPESPAGGGGRPIAELPSGQGEPLTGPVADTGSTGAGLPDLAPPRPAGSGSPAASDPEPSRRTALVRAAERVGPAVVSISVTQIRLVRSNPFARNRDPFDRFFSNFFPGRIYGQEVSNLGSGLIIDSRGIVVTNEHVVRDAKEIKVTLPDGRTFDATLLGADSAYDLGVLKIEGEDLQVAPISEGRELMVGEWAIALGNPFGFLLNDFQPTVTAGVISATNRDIKSGGETEAIYKDMIQTDASINPGNSGGPLVNSLGEVIGINTFIFTTDGGNLGIGFAMPIDTVIRVVREILEHGRVRQVWIGIRVQEITQAVANYFRIRDRHGLLVWGIDENSPATEAGIQVGDIIRQVNGQLVSQASEAQHLIFGAAIGGTITLTLERDGELWETEILLQEMPQD
jgi:serine protease Do